MTSAQRPNAAQSAGRGWPDDSTFPPAGSQTRITGRVCCAIFPFGLSSPKGQGGTPGASLFNAHAVVSFDGTAIYDPSYGLWVASQQEWRDDQEASFEFGTNASSIPVKHQGKKNDTLFTVVPY